MRQAQNQATNTFNQASNFENASKGNAASLYSTLMPQFEQEATNPTGYTPGQKAAMDTASQQSTGGATAGAVGQANLMSARNRNAGSFAPALDFSAQKAGQENSKNALGVEMEDANLKQKKEQEGLSGLQSLYGTNNADVLGSIGAENSSTGTLLNAGQSGWLQNTLNTLNTINQSGKSAADLGWQPFATPAAG